MKLHAEKISKEFIRNGRGSNTFLAVQETDFTLCEGTVTVLTGRSGSGKSTLLNMLCGLSVPTTGKVLLDETDLYTMPDHALSKLRNQNFGVIPQGQTALHSLTVLENILLPFSLYRQPADLDLAEELLEQLDIAKLRDVKPAELSGGELRRMASVLSDQIVLLKEKRDLIRLFALFTDYHNPVLYQYLFRQIFWSVCLSCLSNPKLNRSMPLSLEHTPVFFPIIVSLMTLPGLGAFFLSFPDMRTI